MTKPLPFTQASIKRQILAIEAAGKFAVAVKPDGTVIIGDKPVDVPSLMPAEPEQSPAKRMGDYFNSGRRFGEKLGGQNDSASKWEDKRP